MQQMKDLASLNPDLTSEMMVQIDEIIDRYKDRQGCLIPVLTECQERVGYLPVELQEYIGGRLNIPGSTIYGVSSFYSFFSLIPKGKHIIKVCMGTACYVKGIGEVLSRLQSKLDIKVGATTEDRRFSLESVRCLGACGLAPIVVIDNDTHGGVTPDKILDILENYE